MCTRLAVPYIRADKALLPLETCPAAWERQFQLGRLGKGVLQPCPLSPVPCPPVRPARGWAEQPVAGSSWLLS